MLWSILLQATHDLRGVSLTWLVGVARCRVVRFCVWVLQKHVFLLVCVKLSSQKMKNALVKCTLRTSLVPGPVNTLNIPPPGPTPLRSALG